MDIKQREVREMKGVNYDVKGLNLGDCKNTGTIHWKKVSYFEHSELLEEK